MYVTKRLNLLLCAAVTAVFASMFGMEPTEHKDNTSHLGKEVLVGSAAGLAEGVTGVPFSYFKNMLQQGKSVSLDPRVFYRGFPVNAFCMVPTTALQVGADKVLKDVFPDGDTATAVARGLAAGAFSATTSTPTEMLVLHQQNNGRPLLETTRRLVAEGGMRSLWRGGTAKAGRDAGFAAGFLALYPKTKEAVHAATGSESVAAVAAAVGAGVVTAAATHPFDMVSTCMQADPTKQTVGGMLDTMRTVYEAKGVMGFYKGFAPRATRVGLALCVMGEVKDALSGELGLTERVDESR